MSENLETTNAGGGVGNEAIAVGEADRLVTMVIELTRRVQPTVEELSKLCEVLNLLSATAISVIATFDATTIDFAIELCRYSSDEKLKTARMRIILNVLVSAASDELELKKSRDSKKESCPHVGKYTEFIKAYTLVNGQLDSKLTPPLDLYKVLSADPSKYISLDKLTKNEVKPAEKEGTDEGLVRLEDKNWLLSHQMWRTALVVFQLASQSAVDSYFARLLSFGKDTKGFGAIREMDLEFRRFIVPGLFAQGISLTDIFKQESFSVSTFLKVMSKFQRLQLSVTGQKEATDKGLTGKSFCRRWARTGTCEYGESCRFREGHIEPSKETDPKKPRAENEK
jgi:hypothetical protein